MSSFKDYEEYVWRQKRDFCSYESRNNLWVKGQIRYIDKAFAKIPKTAKVLDIACGDGAGLRYFRRLGYADVVGVEFNAPKASLARGSGYPVYEDDMHDLSRFNKSEFEVVYSSHTLEHAFCPQRAVLELKRILRKGGRLLVVMPYPDDHLFNIRAHPAKFALGTNQSDDGRAVVDFFRRLGFLLSSKSYDAFREPEIWLEFSH